MNVFFKHDDHAIRLKALGKGEGDAPDLRFPGTN